jgi:hypothetical protein
MNLRILPHYCSWHFIGFALSTLSCGFSQQNASLLGGGGLSCPVVLVHRLLLWDGSVSQPLLNLSGSVVSCFLSFAMNVRAPLTA